MKNKCNEILLSLNLIDNTLSDKEKIRRLYIISNNIERNYKTYQISKRTGKKRKISEPNYTLKKIQKNILKNILEKMPPSKYAKAYKKNTSIKDNATPPKKQTNLKTRYQRFL